MRLVLSCLMVATPLTEAVASGGISCMSGDAKAKIEVNAGVTHGMGSPVFQLKATADVVDTSVAEDLRKSSFEKSNLSQYWLDADDLKLLLYRERQGSGAFGSVELLIAAKPVGDDIGYDGRFTLTISDTGTKGTAEGKSSIFEGKVSCSVE